MLSVTDAASRLGVSPVRIRQYIAGGRLPAVKVGSVFVLDDEAVAGFVKRGPGRPCKSSPAAKREPVEVKAETKQTKRTYPATKNSRIFAELAKSGREIEIPDHMYPKGWVAWDAHKLDALASVGYSEREAYLDRVPALREAWDARPIRATYL